MVQLALDTHSWINSPTVYTTFGKDFTSIQQDLMMRVMYHLQPYLKRFYDEGRDRDPLRPNPMMTPEEIRKMPPIRIQLAEFEVGDGHYSTAFSKRTFLDPIRDLWIPAPVFDKETGLRKSDDWFPLFKRVSIPANQFSAEGVEYNYTRKDGETPTRRNGYVELTINDEIAHAFDMTKGYFSHLERIAQWCSSAYTSRIYLLLMQKVNIGQMKPSISYTDLKDFLGMYVRGDGETAPREVIIDEKYPKYSKFESLVLKVAQRDLDRLSKENKTEITFTFEAIRPRGLTRGNPDKIRFNIKRSPLGLARETELHRGSSEKRLIAHLTTEYPEIDREALAAIVQNVRDDVWQAFTRYAYKDLTAAVERPHRWDGSVSDFVLFLLAKWQKGSATAEPPQQLELFGPDGEAAPTQTTEGTPAAAIHDDIVDAPTATTTDSYVLRPGDLADKWEAIVAAYDGPHKDLLRRAHYTGTIIGCMNVLFADPADLKAFEDWNNTYDADWKTFVRHVADIAGAQYARVIKRGLDTAATAH